MRIFIFLTLSFLGFGLNLSAQNLKSIRKQLIYIPSGAYTMGGGYQYEVSGFSIKYLGEEMEPASGSENSILIGELPEPNNPPSLSTVGPFYISSHEVTNFQYKDFLVDSLLGENESVTFWDKVFPGPGDADSAGFYWDKLFALAHEKNLLPDTACWESEFPLAYNKPLSQHYFSHPAFNEYPVVGVSWDQANAYCTWLTAKNNRDLMKRGKPKMDSFRLPTEAEWEYAALGQVNPGKVDIWSRKVYPWEGNRVWDNKGEFRANLKFEPRNYIEDNFEYTAPVHSFKPNGFGLYNIAGNVSEWTSDNFKLKNPSKDFPAKVKWQPANDSSAYRVIKGGSWADYKYAAMVGSRCPMLQNQGYSRVGFRVAMTYH